VLDAGLAPVLGLLAGSGWVCVEAGGDGVGGALGGGGVGQGEIDVRGRRSVPRKELDVAGSSAAFYNINCAHLANVNIMSGVQL